MLKPVLTSGPKEVPKGKNNTLISTPKTGDGSQMILWAVVGSGALIIGIGIIKKRCCLRRKKEAINAKSDKVSKGTDN